MIDDEEEISNLKYHAPVVIALSSGRFAVMRPFSNNDGLNVFEIVEADALHATITEATTLRVNHVPISVSRVDLTSLLANLGVRPPRAIEIKRRL